MQQLELAKTRAATPRARAPSLNDFLSTAVQHSQAVLVDTLVTLADPPRQSKAVQTPPAVLRVAAQLSSNAYEVAALFGHALREGVYSRGGQQNAERSLLRFDDLELFGEAELGHSIELARAQHEMELATAQSLPALDALVSTLMAWRTTQPGLNPLRPQIYAQALQSCLSGCLTDADACAAVIAPLASRYGVRLSKLYQELADWLRSSGVEPALAQDAQTISTLHHAEGAQAQALAKTMLTLEKLRQLLRGEFDAPGSVHLGADDFEHTVPASMETLQEMRQVGLMLRRLRRRARSGERMPAQDLPDSAKRPSALGRHLGDEVVHLMFENLDQDKNLLPELRALLLWFEPVVLALAREDSRFFSDRSHVARRFLDQIAQRGLGHTDAQSPQAQRFLQSVRDAMSDLAAGPAGSEQFDLVLACVQAQWQEHDAQHLARRREAARTLQYVEQRNLLARGVAERHADLVQGRDVPTFVIDFLLGPWAQVVADARLQDNTGADDPNGYDALVPDLLWSVQYRRARRNRLRLTALIPGLLAKLRQGLTGIDFAPERTSQLFDQLAALHQAILEDARELPRLGQNSEQPLEQDSGGIETTPAPSTQTWLAGEEVRMTAYLPDEPAPGDSVAPSPNAETTRVNLHLGDWIALWDGNTWERVQLTWASPYGTLYMFASAAGRAYSMSKRGLKRRLAQGVAYPVSEGPVLEQALDEVARLALANSLKQRGAADGKDKE